MFSDQKVFVNNHFVLKNPEIIYKNNQWWYFDPVILSF